MENAKTPDISQYLSDETYEIGGYTLTVIDVKRKRGSSKTAAKKKDIPKSEAVSTDDD